jgi:hypothetical protein
MGCGCKGGNTPKSEETNNNRNIFKKGLDSIIAIIGGTLLTPIIWGVLIVTIYKSRSGNALDIGELIKSFTKKAEDGEEPIEEDLNPEDYELVGLDKIKD